MVPTALAMRAKTPIGASLATAIESLESAAPGVPRARMTASLSGTPMSAIPRAMEKTKTSGTTVLASA